MPPLGRAISQMRSYLINRRFPEYLGSIADYVVYSSEEQLSTLTESELDTFLVEFGDWIGMDNGHRDVITFKNVSIGPFDEDLDEAVMWRRSLKILLLEMFEYQEDLIGLSFDELKNLFDAQRRTDLDYQRKSGELEDRGRFFNLLESDADFDFWEGIAFWDKSEAAALILGKDPRKVNEKIFKRHRLDHVSSPFVEDFFKLKKAIERAIIANKLPANAGPREFATWSSKNRSPVSERFSNWTNDFLKTSNDEHKSGALGTTERTSMYKILLGLAAAHYGYLPKHYLDERNSAYAAITADVNLSGMGSDVKTVRDYLKAAGEWAHQSEIKLTQPAHNLLRGKSRGKRTIP